MDTLLNDYNAEFESVNYLTSCMARLTEKSRTKYHTLFQELPYPEIYSTNTLKEKQ